MKKVCVSLIIILSIICILSSNIFASTGWNGIYSKDSSLDQQIKTVTEAVKYAGAACAVIMLVYMGIRFLLASPDGQADLKKELPLWLIGCVLLFSPAFLNIVKTGATGVSNKLDTGNIEGAIQQGGGMVLTVFQAVGTSIAVIILVFIGIKFMIESPDGKATLKKRLPTYILGAIFAFAAPQITAVVIEFAMSIN